MVARCDPASNVILDRYSQTRSRAAIMVPQRPPAMASGFSYCMNVGIWCAYGKTLEASEGIGVFAHNLARSLLADARVERVVMAIREGEADRVADTVATGGGRIQTVSVGRLPWLSRLRRSLLRRRHRHLCDRLARGLDPALACRRDGIERRFKALYDRQPVTPRQLFEECDVWLLPYVAVERSFPAATVVVVHDMVPLHIPGVVKPSDLEAFRRRCRCMVRDATLVGTMSCVIRDIDIVGLLGCDVEKVRVVPPAVPSDCAMAEDRAAVSARRAFLDMPYILYPAAFRPYKNHAMLVEALAVLHRRGHRALQAVFTGIRTMPPQLATRIEELGLTGHVHALGKVSRSELARLYAEAVATVVPSLYEQGSFPVLEALLWNCPAAASDLPALREALAPLGDAMVFFDPRSADAIADAIASIIAHRDAIVTRQVAGFAAIRDRTWEDVAGEWAAVFAEAVRQHAAPPRTIGP
jgi:glycosyltransferase involved in cell wall biosynthesis